MKLPESFTKITLLSKILAMILFILLPFIGFYLGINYQKATYIPDCLQQIKPYKPDANNDPTIKKMSALSLNYLHPKGWNVSKEIGHTPWFEYEIIIIQKGEYKLTIGKQSTGGSTCVGFFNNVSYVPLNNKLLGDKVVREIPYGKDKGSVYVCTDAYYSKEKVLGETTRIGEIEYSYPQNWEDNMLKEMDDIVNSLKLKEK